MLRGALAGVGEEPTRLGPKASGRVRADDAPLGAPRGEGLPGLDPVMGALRQHVEEEPQRLVAGAVALSEARDRQRSGGLLRGSADARRLQRRVAGRR